MILNKEGLFIHTCWIGNDEYDFDAMHFFYHDKDELLNIIKKYFTILETSVYKEFEVDDSIFIIAKKI